MPPFEDEAETYLALAAKQARDKFASLNPHPFLVRIADSPQADDPWGDDFSFATRVSDRREVPGGKSRQRRVARTSGPSGESRTSRC